VDGTLTQAELNEYYQRYYSIYRGELGRLYRRLVEHSDKEKVGQAAGVWYNLSNRLVTLADTLTAGLLSLREHWTGTGSAEFMRRGFALVARVLTLADEAAAMQTGLSMMSSVLGIAVQQAKNNQSGELEGLFVDQSYGYTMMSPHSRFERLVKTVAELALHYNLIEHKYWYGPRPERSPEPPPVEPDPGTGGLSTALTGASLGSSSSSSYANPHSPSASSLNQPAAALRGAVAVVAPDLNRLPGPGLVAGDGSVTSMGMMPGMMGMAGAGAGTDSSRNSSRPLSADEIAWSKDDHAQWVDGDADQPPPTIGRTA
jgi:hypothetical protein